MSQNITPIMLESKRFVIVGLQGSGKTELAKMILGAYDNSIVYDVLHEYTGFDRYLVERRQVKRHDDRDPAVAELNTFVNRVVVGSGIIRMFILDEANRFLANKYPLPASILDLNDFQRHQRIAFGVVARRLAQLHTDITELAHYLFIFSLVGKNDLETLESIVSGLGETVRNLKEYEFVVVPPRRQDYYVHPPLYITPEREHKVEKINITNSDIKT